MQASVQAAWGPQKLCHQRPPKRQEIVDSLRTLSAGAGRVPVRFEHGQELFIFERGQLVTYEFHLLPSQR